MSKRGRECPTHLRAWLGVGWIRHRSSTRVVLVMSLPNLTLAPATDPIEIYRLRDGFYATDLLGAAVVHLDFFSWLAEHPADLQGICAGCGLASRPADVMLTLFTALGLVERSS